MARAAISSLTQDQYDRVTQHLANKGTKKAACEMLGMSYNTTKLAQLISQFETRIEAEAEVRAKKRKEPVSPQEVVWWITDYLRGSSLSELSESYFRSEAVIRLHLEKHGAMLRKPKVDRRNPPMLPEQCISEDFTEGQYVWAAAYNCVAVVKGFYKGAVKIMVLSDGIQEHSYQPAYDLGSLKHLADLGVDLTKFTAYLSGPEVIAAVNDAVRAANRRAGKE
jgi:hypothetical protein